MHQSAFATLTDWLAEQNYLRVDLEGAVMMNRASAHAEIGRAFGFPYWHGKGWGAFSDCMYQFAREHEDERVAVLWHHLDEAAAFAPATVAEVGWALLGVHTGSSSAPNGSLPYSMSVDVFAIGSADDFDREPSG